MADVKQPKVADQVAALKDSVPAPVGADRKVELLQNERLQTDDYVRSRWVATVAASTLPEDLLDPAYWALVSVKLRPRDVVEAWSEDGTWAAEYVVLGSDRAWARVRMRWCEQHSTADVSLSQAAPGYKVVWRGYHHKWSVIRSKDGAVVHQGSDMQGQAEAWLREHVKVVPG